MKYEPPESLIFVEDYHFTTFGTNNPTADTPEIRRLGQAFWLDGFMSMTVRLGDECAECGKNTDDRCLHCHEPVCSWEKVPNPAYGAVPLPCYEEHRKGSCTR